MGARCFENCSSLERVEFSSQCTFTSLEDNSFYNCTSLEDVQLPVSLQKIGKSAFVGCDNLCKIIVPENVRSIGFSCFSGCKSLSEVSLSSSLKEISQNCFSWCSALEDISIPASVRTIGSWAFVGANLKEVRFSDGLVGIGSYSFSKNINLTKVTIPSTVEALGTGCFDDCNALSEIACLAVTPPSLQGVSAYLPMFPSDIASNCTLYVPEESIQKYIDDKNWSVFNQIKAYKNTSGIDGVSLGSNAQVEAGEGRIYVQDIPAGEKVSAYTMAGVPLPVEYTDNNHVMVRTGSGVVLLKIGKKTRKLIIK